MNASPWVVVIGASAGGIEALRTIAAGLPRSFSSPICVVLHASPESPGILPDILRRAGPLPATNACDSERLRPGHIYVAPADHHLLVEPGIVRVTKGPRENRFRPAIDPLLRSAAHAYGPSAIGVILTGNLDDGAAGLWLIKQLGGVAVVQDPRDALFPAMSLHASHRVAVDHSVPVSEIAPLLVELAAKQAHAVKGVLVPDHVNVELRIAKEENPRDAGLERIGEPSRYACPECHGALLLIREGDHDRFRCHIGHAYSIGSLMADFDEGIERALEKSIRAFEESALLMDRIAHQSRGARQHDDCIRYERASAEARRHSETTRQMLRDRHRTHDEAARANDNEHSAAAPRDRPRG